MSTTETFRLSKGFEGDPARIAARILSNETDLTFRADCDTLTVELGKDVTAEDRHALKRRVGQLVGIECNGA